MSINMEEQNVKRQKKKEKTREIDMLHGPFQRKLIAFALPIAASSMFQQLFNAADTAVVGKFADADALAAVGTNGEIVALLVSLSLGLAVGANVLLARLTGEGKKEETSRAAYTALALAFVLGIFGAVAGQWIARPLLRMIHTPESVLELAVLYLKIYFAGYPALLVYDFGAAVLRARGDSRRPFVILSISGGLNLLLNLALVIGCRLGVAGVAIATDLSSLCAAGMVLLLLFREERFAGFCPKHAWSVLKIGIPAALQGAVFCFANLFVQAAVNSFGTVATAGSAIAMNFEYFGYYMITAFGQAATTFTSQNVGAGKLDNCKKILHRCLWDSVVFSGIVILPLILGREAACGIFSSEEGVVEQACLRMMLILIFEPACGFYEVPAGYLRGRGHSALPAGITILGTCLLRIIWVETIFAEARTLQSLFLVFLISWLLTSALMWGACFYLKKRVYRKRGTC